MSFRRIVETEPLSVEAQLLRIGRSMQPPASAYRKTLVGLGIAASAATSASLAGAASTTTMGAKSVVAAWLSGAAAKGIAVGFIAGATVLGATQVGTTLHPAPPAEPSVTTRSAPRSLPAHAVVESMSSASDIPLAPELDSSLARNETQADMSAGSTKQTSDAVERLKSAGARSAAALPKGRGSISEASLGAEVTLIDEVRSALDHREAGRALDFLAQYQERFPNARLGEEAMFLRARAFKQLGRHSDAADSLQQFQRAYPDSSLSEQP